MVTLNTEDLSPKQSRMVLVALQLRKESAEENQDTRDANAWARVIEILTTSDSKGTIAMAKAKTTKAAKTVSTPKTHGQKAAAKIPAWKAAQDEVDKSVAKGIKMLHETTAPTDKGHRKIAKLKAIKAGLYGTYYPQGEPNGLSCLIVRQTDSGRWLIMDMSTEGFKTTMETHRGGSYYLAIDIRFRTVDGSRLTTYTGKWSAEERETHELYKPFYLSYAALIKDQTGKDAVKEVKAAKA